MEVSLWQVKKGQSCEIAGLGDSLPGAYRTRLVELGFVPGARVSCLVAPFLGAPRLYRVRNTVYSLERQVAQCIQVCEVEQ